MLFVNKRCWRLFFSCSEGIERYKNPCVARSTMGCRRREQVVEGAAFLVWLSVGGSCREEEARNVHSWSQFKKVPYNAPQVKHSRILKSRIMLPHFTEFQWIFDPCRPTTQACTFGCPSSNVIKLDLQNALGGPCTRRVAEDRLSFSSNIFMLGIVGSFKTSAGGLFKALVPWAWLNKSEISRRSTIFPQISWTSKMEMCKDLENAQRWQAWPVLQMAKQ